jgi:hypothetical protein
VDGYAWSRRVGGSAEGVDITNANRGAEGDYDLILKERRRRTGRHALNTCTCNRFRVGGAEFGSLFEFFAC